MGNLKWSDTFDKLSDAVQCYESWLQRYGSNPERHKEKISSYFEYGAHGARVSVVMEVRLLREKITQAQDEHDDGMSDIWAHTVRIERQNTTNSNPSKHSTCSQQSKKSKRRLMLRKQQKHQQHQKHQKRNSNK